MRETEGRIASSRRTIG